ncbi:MAG: substrate-binding domain-containing protein [Acidobacteria bacterium]|nr:substrate-binding domain-containing protein [Acidobacteriota bacterium]
MRFRLSFVFTLFFLIVACNPPLSEPVRLRLATTTSVQDSGLLPYLLPHFEGKCSCRVDVIAVGTGQALKLAENGDVDMVLVHAPDLEKKFVSDGYGINRQTFMVNDFVILGPESDPAQIKGMADAAGALLKIRDNKALFISRGDNSGTHQKEKSLWEKTGINPAGSWYLEIGQGMGAVLTMADEKDAYTVCDRGTYLSRKHQLKLQVLAEGDPLLLNYYSAIPVSPERYPEVKANLSRQLTEWLCSPEGQNLIGEYIVGGNQLFKPSYVSGK